MNLSHLNLGNIHNSREFNVMIFLTIMAMNTLCLVHRVDLPGTLFFTDQMKSSFGWT